MKERRARGTAPRDKVRDGAVLPGPRKGVQPRWRVALALLALCGMTALAYSNSFHDGFTLDSKTLLLKDARIREATLGNLALIFQHTYWWPYGESGLYRPVTTLSYLFNYAILGNRDHPEGYHWINLALHLGNVLLVYALAGRLLRQRWPAFFVAALWALHPVSTEAVTNIVGRSDLMAAMAVLSGFLIYLKRTEAVTPAGRAGWLAGLSAVSIVGMLAKESTAMLPALVILYELTWWRGRQELRRLLPGWAAIIFPMLAIWRARAVVLAGSGPVEFPLWDNPLTRADFWTARLTAITIMPRYIWLAVWPQNLSCDYSYSQITLARGSIEDWLGWLVAAGCLVTIAILFRRHRTAFFFASFACVAFLPTSNLLFPIGTIMAERFLYLPSVGLVACLVIALYGAGRRASVPRAAPIALGLVAAAFAIRTWVRNLDWRDDLTMATAAARTAPKSFKTHYLLSQALYESDPGHSQLDRVIGENEKSLAILETLPDTLNDAAPYQWGGECYLLKGDLLRRRGPDGSSITPPESEQAYRRSLQILLKCVSINRASPGQDHPSDAAGGLYRTLSIAYLRLMDTRKAFEAAAYALQIEPLKSEGYRQIAGVLAAEGRAGEAAVRLLEGVILTGDSALSEELIGLYGNGLDRDGCAIVLGPRGPTLNPECDTVRRHFCAAAADSIRVDLQTARQYLALETKRAALQRYHCPAGTLDQILP